MRDVGDDAGQADFDSGLVYFLLYLSDRRGGAITGFLWSWEECEVEGLRDFGGLCLARCGSLEA